MQGRVGGRALYNYAQPQTGIKCLKAKDSRTEAGRTMEMRRLSVRSKDKINIGVVGESWVLEADRLEPQILLPDSPGKVTLESHRTPCLECFICKMGTATPSAYDCCRDHIKGPCMAYNMHSEMLASLIVIRCRSPFQGRWTSVAVISMWALEPSCPRHSPLRSPASCVSLAESTPSSALWQS